MRVSEGRLFSNWALKSQLALRMQWTCHGLMTDRSPLPVTALARASWSPQAGPGKTRGTGCQWASTWQSPL